MTHDRRNEPLQEDFRVDVPGIRLTSIGIVLPTRGLLIAGESDFGLLGRLAERAEQLGVDSVWVGDSLVAKPRLEPLTVLASVASLTSRVGLGTAVLLGALRQPVLLAQQAATVDLLSNGRLTLGMGVGGTFNAAQQAEWQAAGIETRGRGSRLGEAVALMQRLWSGERVSFQGRHFDIEDVSLGFQPQQSPRIRTLLACHSGEGLQVQHRRAARLADGLISITESPESFTTVRQSVLAEAAALGRSPEKLTATYYLTVNINQSAETAFEEADAWVRGYYGLNYWQDRWGPYGPPEAIIERAQAMVNAGADELIFRFAARDQMAQLESFVSEVMPALK